MWEKRNLPRVVAERRRYILQSTLNKTGPGELWQQTTPNNRIAYRNEENIYSQHQNCFKMYKTYNPNIRIASQCEKKEESTNSRSWGNPNPIIRIASISWREIHPQNIYIWAQLAQGHSRDQSQHQNCFKMWGRKKANIVASWCEKEKTTSLVECKNKAHLCSESHKIITWSSPAASHDPWLSRWTWHLPPL